MVHPMLIARNNQYWILLTGSVIKVIILAFNLTAFSRSSRTWSHINYRIISRRLKSSYLEKFCLSASSCINQPNLSWKWLWAVLCIFCSINWSFFFRKALKIRWMIVEIILKLKCKRLLPQSYFDKLVL